VGVLILFLFPEAFRELKTYSPFITAVILLLVVYLMPQGLVGLPGAVRSLFAHREEERTEIGETRDSETLGTIQAFWR